VPGLVGVVVVPPPPPPQATKPAASRTSDSDPRANFNRRFLVGMSSRKKAAKIAPPKGANQRGALKWPITVDGAVVVTVSVAVLPGLIELLTEQPPPVIVDETLQVRETAELKPLMELIEIVEFSESPWTGTVIEGGVDDKLKSPEPDAMLICVDPEVDPM